MERKIWTYEEARKILPYVRSITEEFYETVGKVHQELKNGLYQENEQEAREAKVEELLVDWSGKIR